ncbi:MAG: nucleoside deaminase [Bacteroidetes bacterium]|jgi:guanine deaminase|nr:nucleoside deaminase [Bacteroidota bacterium]MBT3748102.1 nucleoside deaminase [Bacteroidota bacterium]MBT4401539.1 nucleoside deaminase [Bacteroidota bacterium]MBT4410456.1 nucleoside deaminase [Bacteroidota bacterium]MBT5427959.1 nucleoside deaminase [Bacteroidota bacterium]
MKKTYNIPDQEFILKTIELAQSNVQNGGGPFGALVVKDGKIIATGVNRVTDKHDPTAHAEVMAIREASRLLGNHELEGCTLFSSCEPCPMCLGAVYWARIKRLVFASDRHNAREAGFSDAMIYEEIHLPVEERSLKTEQITIPQAGAEFIAWHEQLDREEY